MNRDKELEAAKEALKSIIDCYERSNKRGRNCAYTMWRTARNYLGFLNDLEKKDTEHAEP